MPDLVRIEAREKQIADVFSDKYAFTIPPYQRPYAWEVQQVTELLDDLLEAMDPKSRSEGLYFLGSIVLVKSPSHPDSKVVDGQQRLGEIIKLARRRRSLTQVFISDRTGLSRMTVPKLKEATQSYPLDTMSSSSVSSAWPKTPRRLR